MDFVLDRASTFSFACRACGRCCSGKVIMAGPHEVLGMSRLLGIGTTEFLAKYANNGGTTLRADAAGRCVFVSDRGGCQVHPARPLVCRLYPLGRAVDGAGEERFAVFPKQEGCEAEFGTEGTVAGFLGSQGVAPYFEWSDRYGRLYHRMMALLERLGVEGKIEVEAGGEESGTEEAGGAGGDEAGTGADSSGIPADQAADASPLSTWQDIDASLAEYCAAKGIALPEGIEASIDLHLRAIEEWLDELEETNNELP